MKNTITLSVKWVGWLLLGMGALFFIVGMIVPFFVNSLGRDDLLLLMILYPSLFGGFGLIMMIIGGIILGRISARERMHQRLLNIGYSVWAQVEDLRTQYHIHINRLHPLVLYCQYGGQRFKSAYLRFDPTAGLPQGRVRVWLNPDDVSQYYVDVDDSLQTHLDNLR